MTTTRDTLPALIQRATSEPMATAETSDEPRRFASTSPSSFPSSSYAKSPFLHSIYISYFELFSFLPPLVNENITIILLNYEKRTGQLNQYTEFDLSLTNYPNESIPIDSIRYIVSRKCPQKRYRLVLDHYPQICSEELGDGETTMQSTAHMGVDSFMKYQQQRIAGATLQSNEEAFNQHGEQTRSTDAASDTTNHTFCHQQQQTTYHAWKQLPLDIILYCMLYARDLPDILVWRLVSREVNQHLKETMDAIPCLDMKSSGGQYWEDAKYSPGTGLDSFIRYFGNDQIQSLIFPKEHHVTREEFQHITQHCTSLKHVTLYFPSLYLHRIFAPDECALMEKQHGHDHAMNSSSVAAWNNSVEELEFIGLYLTPGTMPDYVLDNVLVRFPNLKFLTFDFCKYAVSDMERVHNKMASTDVQIVQKTHSNGLSRITTIDTVKYAVEHLHIDPNMAFQDVHNVNTFRSTTLLDTAVLRSDNVKREQILKYLVGKGASIRDSLSRIGWWHTFTYPEENGHLEKELNTLVQLCSPHETAFTPSMFRSLAELEGIDVMTEKEISTIFKLIPSHLLRDQEFLFEAVRFKSPLYHDLFVRILKENMHSGTNAFMCDPDAGDSETLLSLAIANTEFITDEDIEYMLSFPFEVDKQVYGGNTYLHLAIQSGRLNIAVQLIQGFYANVHMKNNQGDDCLHVACSLNDLNFAADLVSRFGANIESRNGKGQTPYEVALRSRIFYHNGKQNPIPDILWPQGGVSYQQLHPYYQGATNSRTAFIQNGHSNTPSLHSIDMRKQRGAFQASAQQSEPPLQYEPPRKRRRFDAQ